MRPLVFLFSIILTLSVYASVNVGHKITAKKFNEKTFGVGDIKQSLLTEAQFQTQFGDCWVKMKGQDVSSSDYATTTGKNNLPNAEGRFLRNIGGNAPALGVTQEDAFKKHSHRMFRSTGGGDNNNVPAYPSVGVTGESSGAEGYNGSSTANGLNEATGGVETRPVNLGVNFFVKINHNCN